MSAASVEIHEGSESVFSKKRRRLSSGGPESEEQSRKKLTVANGEREDRSAEIASERVVILDAGAQYGKV